VLLRNHETGLTLRQAPEFGPDGAWPPLASDWVPLRWELFEADQSDFRAVAAYAVVRSEYFAPYRDQKISPLSDDSYLTEDGLLEDFPGRVMLANFPPIRLLRVVLALSKTGQVLQAGAAAENPFDSAYERSKLIDLEAPDYEHEMRRLVYSVRWRRKDPVTRLPPGVTHEMTHSVTTGLSVAHSETLADSLGLSLGMEAVGIQAKLSSQLQQQFGLTLEITAQEQRSTKLTVSNPSADRTRLFALWHVDHRVAVDALSINSQVISEDSYKIFYNAKPAWEPRGSIEFATESDPHITFAEVRPA
jgi:hypothetical protein